MLYYAEIHAFGVLPNLEIDSVSQFEELPFAWTYPEIQPKLLEKADWYPAFFIRNQSAISFLQADGNCSYP